MNIPIGITKQQRVVLLVLLALLAGVLTFVGYGYPSKVLSCLVTAPVGAVDGAQGKPSANMAWVPAGTFDFGDTLYPEEGPITKRTVAGFWMDKTEVTNDQFAAFVKATGYVTVAERPVDSKLHAHLPKEMRLAGAVVFVIPKAGQPTEGSWWRYVPGANWQHPSGPQSDIEGRGHFPVVAVAYEDAQAYATWLGRDLPTEVEWEWAATGGLPKLPTAAPSSLEQAKQHQPKAANTWQGVFPMMNSKEDGFEGVAPVGCYAPNAFGLHDMIGNVWELTSDTYKPSHNEAARPDQVPLALRPAQQAVQRVIKGGSFLCSPDYCIRYRAGSRQPQDEDLGASHLGFRTIVRPPPQKG